jgi:predicted nuclease of predicted toxin-antitoxin system
VRIKLDENFDVRLAAPLAAAGHDVDTVRDEGLAGSGDATIYATCLTTGRVLITLDIDFANPFRFPPEPTKGIVVVRPPKPVLTAIRATLLSVLPQLRADALWIVEPGRIRVYDPDDTPDALNQVT